MNENPLFRSAMPTFMGIKVIPNEHVQPVPRLQLSPNFKWCTPEFRFEYNAWLLNRFGTKEVFYVFQRSAFGEGGIVMNPKQIAMLQLRNW